MQFLNIADAVSDDREAFVPEGVCAKEITFEIVDGKLKDLNFVGGCQGNLEAISILLEDMPVEEVIEKMQGIACGKKTTSCTDQLTKILQQQLAVA